MSLTNQAYQQAVITLKKCVTAKGLFASGAKEGYRAVWARDAFIALLGGSLVDEEFKKVFKKSINLMVKHQSELGQIPNCVGDYNLDRKSDVTFATIDSSLWFIIAEYVYAKSYQSKKLLKKHHESIERTMRWLRYQDSGEDHLPEQQPTSDWQDAFPHKYGHAINTQALYYQVLKLVGQKKQAKTVKRIVNGQDRLDMKMFDSQRGYYLPWIWKNHDGDREQGEWFDSLGNLLAILTDLAEVKQATAILNYIQAKGINKPFPIKSIFPPLKKGDREWHSYFEKCEAKKPYHYANAGIWPFLGGFYVAALVKLKKFSQAKEELNNLAQANKLGLAGEWKFNEWLDGATGKPTSNDYQAWSAGMYIYAYECVKRKKVIWF